MNSAGAGSMIDFVAAVNGDGAVWSIVETVVALFVNGGGLDLEDASRLNMMGEP